MKSNMWRMRVVLGCAMALGLAGHAAGAPVFVRVAPTDEAVRSQRLAFRAYDAAGDFGELDLTVTKPGGGTLFSLHMPADQGALQGYLVSNELSRLYGVASLRYVVRGGTTGIWQVVVNTAHPAWQQALRGATLDDFGFSAALFGHAVAGATTNYTLGVLNAAACDFNGDGVSDAVLFRGGDGKLRVNESVAGETDPLNWPAVWDTTKGNPSWVPATGDYDGDGVADKAWYVPADGTWRIVMSSLGAERQPRPTFGGSGETPCPADFDGDGKTDLAVVQEDGRIRVCTGNHWFTDIGDATWKPAPADFDGDGITDPAWFVAASGAWRILESSAGFVELRPRPLLGHAGQKPVPADFDGDGKADLAVFDRATGQILYRSSRDGRMVTSSTGDPAWLPAVADYDGDGRADMAWFVPATARFRIFPSGSGADLRLAFGTSDDRPVRGDFDGDGKADLAVAQPDGRIHWKDSSTGVEHTSDQGQAGWLPAVADYDNDGKADLAWYVPATGAWRIHFSALGYQEIRPRSNMGRTDDLPVPGDYDGDGKADLALFVGRSGHFRVCTGRTWVSSDGDPAWRPAIADYDGDGKADFAWFVRSNQTWRVCESSRGYAPRPDVTFGGRGDWPLTGDFDGDGKADLALFRTNWTVRVRESGSGATYTTALPRSSAPGDPLWKPAIADYNGDGRGDIAWYRAEEDNGKFRIIYSDADNADGNAAVGQRVATAVLGTAADYPVIRPFVSFTLIGGGGSTIAQIGDAEFVGPGGYRPAIAADAANQPHAVLQVSMGGPGLYLYDKVGGAWRTTLFNSTANGLPNAEADFPRIQVEQANNRIWISAIGLTVGDESGCGIILISRTHGSTSPSAPAVFWDKPLGEAVPIGMVAVDPRKRNRAYVWCNKGFWQEYAGASDDNPAISKTANNGINLIDWNVGGERMIYGFDISKAPRSGKASVWHAAYCGHPALPSIRWNGYNNTARQEAGQQWAVWGDPSIYADPEEDNYMGLGVDNVNPLAAYMAIYGQDNKIYFNVYDGANMTRSAAALATMPAAVGIRRYGPQWAAASGGGAWLCWTGDDGHIKLRWIGTGASSTYGPIVDVCAGEVGSIATDGQGSIHLVYTDGGVTYYRKITTR